MLIVTGKKEYWVQPQLEDYSGKFKVKFIDLRYKQGRILFEQIFHREKSTQGEEVKKEVTGPSQTNLETFGWILSQKPAKSGSRSFRLPYQRQVHQVGPDEFMAGKLPWAEIEALQHYSTATGYLKDLFLLNNFQFWEQLALTPEQEALFGNFCIGDLVKLEIGRCKLGYTKYNNWVKELAVNLDLRDSFGLQNDRLPDPKNYGRLITAIGAVNLRAFHALLVEEFERYGLVDYQIGIWDGRFFKSNCSGQKSPQTHILSDPDCGKCVKGRYKGAGYTESPIMDWKYNLILYYDVIPANRNDKIAFRTTFQSYLAQKKPRFKIFLTDGGAGASHTNLQLVADQGTIPLLKWEKSSNPEVVKTPKGNYFHTKYIPPPYIPHLDLFYNLRTKEERMFSPFDTVYQRTQMPNRGKENALIFTSFTAITQGLTALTAYKTGRLDLIQAATAFRDVSSNPTPNKGWDAADRQICSTPFELAT